MTIRLSSTMYPGWSIHYDRSDGRRHPYLAIQIRPHSIVFGSGYWITIGPSMLYWTIRKYARSWTFLVET